KKPFVAMYQSGRPTADGVLSNNFLSGARGNDTGWSNPEFDKLLLQARAEVDESKRKELYARMQEIVSNGGSTIIPIFPKMLHGVSSRLGHGAIAGDRDFD